MRPNNLILVLIPIIILLSGLLISGCTQEGTSLSTYAWYDVADKTSLETGGVWFKNIFDGTSIPSNFGPLELMWDSNGMENFVISLKTDLNSYTFATEKDVFTIPESEWDSIISEGKGGELIIQLFSSDGSVVKSSENLVLKISENPIDRYITYRRGVYPLTKIIVPTLYYTDLATHETSELLTPEFCMGCHVIAPSEDRMSFSSRRVTENGKIPGVDVVSGDGDYQLISKEDGSVAMSGSMMASWHPDGDRVAIAYNQRPHFPEGETYDKTGTIWYGSSGNIGIYDAKKEEFNTLPGADSEEFTEFWPFFHPDGKVISFARGTTYDYSGEEETKGPVNYEKTLDFDIYVMDFNDGEGGVAKPLEGASDPDSREYFQRYSPDGNWLIFNRAEGTGDIFLENSDLYILPSVGGESKILPFSNPDHMESLVAWSSNSRWIVFTSRMHMNSSRLFFAEVSEEGIVSMPIMMPGQDVLREGEEDSERVGVHHPYFVKDKRKLMMLAKSFIDYNK